MNLDEVRKDINSIDKDLVLLLKKRMDCSLKVAEIKRAENMPIYRPDREREILLRVTDEGGEYGNYISEIYRAIMENSRGLQQASLKRDNEITKAIACAQNSLPQGDGLCVACPGVGGSFTNAAAQKLFPNCKPLFFESFKDVFAAVDNNTATVGVVPVENSTAGSVSETYDLILKYRHYIIGAVDVKINQNLLACEGADLSTIRTVYSHPQALMQCDEYIKANNFVAMEYSNTAAAAQMVKSKNDKTVAAIGSEEAAKLYGLKIVEPEIQSIKHNVTRFIAVSKSLVIPDGGNKVSLVFTLPHVKGSLCGVLERFARCGLNLTKIESRTTGGKFEYQFYLDFDGRVGDRETINLISALCDEMPQFTFLGNYKEIPLAE